tara:strand:+ start:2538 stop:3158 length:621 start_codon:yes stop_codon:yes gene_type:complete
MPTRFPKNPVNGTEVSLGGRTWRYNSTYGVWDKVGSVLSGSTFDFVDNGITLNGHTLSIDTTTNISLQGISASQGATFQGIVYALGGISLGAGGITFPDGTGVTSANRTDGYSGQIETAADKTYTIDPKVPTTRTITGFFVQSGSGTVTATLKNASLTVKAASVSTSSGAQTSLGNTSVPAGTTLTMVTSSNSSATDVVFNIEYIS